MTEKQYVDAITKKLTVTRQRKKEIEQQLLADIAMRKSQGEKPEDIFAQMGTAGEVAEGFNETISDGERRKYKRNKVIKIILPVVAAAAALIALVYWIMPKGRAIEDSDYFTKEQVQAAIIETVMLFDEGDYTSMQQNAIPQMKNVLNKETMDEVKKQISQDWGERTQFGNVYIQELIQKNTHFALGQITVTYDNIVVTYTLTYDTDMRLAGLYMK